MATKTDLDLARAKAIHGVSDTEPLYFVYSPVGALLAGKRDFLEDEHERRIVRDKTGGLRVAGSDEEIPAPKPFGMFGVEFEKGVGVTTDKARAERICREFPTYVMEP